MPPIVPILLVFVLVMVVLMFVEAHRVRRAGISDAQPACGRCLYLMGNWSSSVCPECGTDAAEQPVRVGPRVDRVAYTGLGGIVLAAVLMFGMDNLTGRMFARLPWTSEVVLARRDPPPIAVHIDTSRTWRPWTRYAEGADIITIAQAPGASPADLWPWSKAGALIQSSTTLSLSGWNPDVPHEDIDAAVRTALAGFPEADIAQAIESVDEAVELWLEIQQAIEAPPDDNQELLSRITWLGFETRTQTSLGLMGRDWPAFVLESLMIPLGFLIAWLLARRVSRAGMRAARDGEWSGGAGVR